MSLTLNAPKQVALDSFQTLPLSMHHQLKEIADIECNTTNGKS